MKQGKKGLTTRKFFGVIIALFILISMVGGSENGTKDKNLTETTKPTTSNAAPEQTDTASKRAMEHAAQPTSRVAGTEVRTETATEPVPYETITQDDQTLAAGRTTVIPGITGLRTITYEVTYASGVETARKVLSSVVTLQPMAQVNRKGTKAPAPSYTYSAPSTPATTTTPASTVPSSSCDPNYSGACVPIASDVDCAGGSGNGPAYVRGPVRVIGSDIYDLDRDGDGVGCQ